jgi:hypothetical protein
MPGVVIKTLTKRDGEVSAVEGLSLAVPSDLTYSSPGLPKLTATVESGRFSRPSSRPDSSRAIWASCQEASSSTWPWSGL